MYMLRIIIGGLVLLGAVVLAARLLARFNVTLPVSATTLFIGLWAGAAIVNFYLGVTRAGIPVLTELGASAVIFAVPAAIAWFLTNRI